MFKPTKATDVASYLAQVPDEHKDLVLFVDKFIKKSVPKLKPYFAYNMLGYGSFAALNSKKEKIEWPTIALANRKNYISLYVCAVDQGMYIAEKYKKELGNANVGKSCISFIKIDELNLPVLKKILQFAAKNPGLEGLQANGVRFKTLAKNVEVV